MGRTEIFELEKFRFIKVFEREKLTIEDFVRIINFSIVRFQTMKNS